jgi:hypothetical protein
VGHCHLSRRALLTAATKKKTTLKLVRYVKLPNGKVVVKPPGVSGLLSFAPPPPPPPFVPRVEKVAREKVDGKRPGKLEGRAGLSCAWRL